MVNFGGRLRRQKWPPWGYAYIDYEILKRVLAQAVVRRDRRIFSAETLVLPRSGLSTPMSPDDDVFIRHLDKEVEKVVLFFLATQGDIAARLLDLRVRMKGLALTKDVEPPEPSKQQLVSPGGKVVKASTSPVCSPWTSDSPLRMIRTDGRVADVSVIAEEYHVLCDEVVRLLAFVELNSEALQKILKKHDKLMTRKRIDGPRYLSTRVSRSADSHLRQLYYHNGLSAICSSLSTAVGEMAAVDDTGDSHGLMRESLATVQSARARLQQRNASTVSHFLSLKPLIFDQEELERGLRMAQAEEEEQEELLRMTLSLRMAAWLNIGSVFLTGMTYYATIPTTQAYADALGLDLSYSGIIIGMSPIAQVFSALLFSHLSNYAIRGPLLVSSVFQLLGNLLYAVALIFHSLPMLLAGRFLGGAGSAEAINRRFIADCIPPQERTAASIAFVTAAAMGMASGPALAAALYSVDFTVGPLLVNAATAPAYFLVVVWAVYILCVLFFFHEPRRLASKLASPSTPFASPLEPSPRSSSSKGSGLTVAANSINSTSAPRNIQGDKHEGVHLLPPSSTVITHSTSYGSSSLPPLPPKAAPPDMPPSLVLNSTPYGIDIGDSFGDGPPDYMSSLGSLPDLEAEEEEGGEDLLDDEAALRYYKKQKERRRKRRGRAGESPDSSLFHMVTSNRPLLITLAVYFLIELVDEIIVSSAGVIAARYFDWGVLETGSFLALLGVLILPTNYLISEAAGPLQDRTILVTCEVVTIVGLLTVLSYWGRYSEYQFLSGTVIIFVSVAVMEGVDTSLMSKVIPPVLSRGTFNSGLLAMQVGTVGKAVGDAMITIIGLNAAELVDGLYMPILIITSVLLIITVRDFDVF